VLAAIDSAGTLGNKLEPCRSAERPANAGDEGVSGDEFVVNV